MNVILAAPNEDEKAEAQPAPANRNLTKLAVVLAVVDIVQRGAEIEPGDVGEIQAMLGQVARALRFIPGDHGNNVATEGRSVNELM